MSQTQEEETVGVHPTQRTFQLELPMRMDVSKTTVKPLNMNTYRNLHYHSLNYQKKAFKELVEPLLRGLPCMERIKLRYQIFPKSKRLFDVVNICSIVDKYFSDALTEVGVIPDDNYEHLDEVNMSFGGFSEREHVLVTIIETEPKKEENMKILLDEQDIQNALDTFVLENAGISGATGVQLIAGDDGTFSAEVLMGDAVTTAPKPKRKSPAKKTTVAKPKPEKETPDVEADSAGGTDGDNSGPAEDPQPEPEAPKTARKPKAAEAEGGDSKNLFEDSPAESSSTDSEAEVQADTQTEAPVTKGGSIFDDD